MLEKNLETMTVEEVIALLSKYPKNSKVVFSYPSGDYWRTSLVAKISGIEEKEVKYTPYHQRFQLVGEEETGLPVLVLG